MSYGRTKHRGRVGPTPYVIDTNIEAKHDPSGPHDAIQIIVKSTSQELHINLFVDQEGGIEASLRQLNKQAYVDGGDA